MKAIVQEGYGSPDALKPSNTRCTAPPATRQKCSAPGASVARSNSENWPIWWYCGAILCSMSATHARSSWS
jgi:hypothetical protein